MAGLTAKQDSFVREYLIDMNATQAAIRAKYSKKTATEMGYENLTKPHIQEALRVEMDKRAKRTEVSQDWVVDHLKTNVERSMQEVEVKKDGKGVGEFQYNGAVANKSLELVGKHLGMFTDKLVHTGPDGGPIEISEGLDLARRVAFMLTKAQKETENG